MKTPENETETLITEDALRKEYPNLGPAMQRMLEYINNLPAEERAMVLNALARYEKESKQGSYKTDPQALIKFLTDERLIDGSKILVDLGAGPGDLLYQLAPIFPDTTMVGLDLSPGFARNFNRKTDFIPGDPGYRDASLRINPLVSASMKVGLIDAPFKNEDFDLDKKEMKASAISVLTLDRLANPRILIENMARFTRSKILATLLPVIPEDDNPSRQDDDIKIIYTRPENRIVPGRTAAEDREKLLRVLKDVWRKPVDTANVPYTVLSSGDKQDYDLAVFYARA